MYELLGGRHESVVSRHRKLSAAISAMKRYLNKKCRKSDSVAIYTIDDLRPYGVTLVRAGEVEDADGRRRRPLWRFTAVIARLED